MDLVNFNRALDDAGIDPAEVSPDVIISRASAAPSSENRALAAP